MSEGDPILAKADALMRRHRVFVAHAPETAVAPVPQPLDGNASDLPSDEDIPLLTDVVAEMAGEASLAARNAIPAGISAAELQRWLDEELPTAVLAVLDGVTDKLVEVLTAKLKRDLIDGVRPSPNTHD